MTLHSARRMAHVSYEIRGPIQAEALRLERQGREILRLNLGNPAIFGFSAPEHVLDAVASHLRSSQGYCDSKGILDAREAICAYQHLEGVPGLTPDDVYLGNGVSELIVMSLQALLDDGDEVLLPMPTYPLWSAGVSLAGGKPVYYHCVERAAWQPDLADLESRINPRTRALLVINPNNPTGAVYPRSTLEAMVDIARRHNLVLLSDEIYEQILFDGVRHTSTASLAPDLTCLTFNGLSKAYLLAGFRVGWAVVSGPRELSREYVLSLDTLASMRLCSNVPAQWAVRPALSNTDTASSLVLPRHRLHESRAAAHAALTSIPGVSCVLPEGALYAFPRLDPERYPVQSDLDLVLGILQEEQVLLTHGTAFGWDRPDHLRVVFLPEASVLTDAIGRIGSYLERHYPS